MKLNTTEDNVSSPKKLEPIGLNNRIQSPKTKKPFNELKGKIK